MFGKKCCGKCLQGTLDRESRAASQPTCVESVQTAPSEAQAPTRFFGGAKPDPKRLFTINLANEWMKA